MEKIPETITKEWLVKHGACLSAVKNFIKLFPDGMKVNAVNLLKAHKSKLEVCWLAERVYPGEFHSKLCTLCFDDADVRAGIKEFLAALKCDDLILKTKRKTA